MSEYIKKEDALGCFTWQNTKEDVWYAIKDLPTYSFPERGKGEIHIDNPRGYQCQSISDMRGKAE